MSVSKKIWGVKPRWVSARFSWDGKLPAATPHVLVSIQDYFEETLKKIAIEHSWKTESVLSDGGYSGFVCEMVVAVVLQVVRLDSEGKAFAMLVEEIAEALNASEIRIKRP